VSWAEILAHVELELPWVLLLLPAPLLVWLLLPAHRERQESVRLPFFEDAAAATGRKPSSGAVVLRLNWLQRILAPLVWALERAAEEMFRHKVLGLLRRRGLVSQERVELLLSWRRSGFSVHNRVFAHPGDGRDFEALVRYMMRSPVSLSRLRFSPGAADELVARVLVQIPDPRRHLVRDYGAYSNRARG
jgi:hypothetical protein